MADSKDKASAAVRDLPAEYPDEPGSSDQHNLPIVEVDSGDMPDAEPLHTLAAKSDVFDPNAALRNKLGYGPGLQDSEAKNPAVWSQEDSKEARDAAADAEVKRAERALARAKARAKAIRAGDPLDREAGGPLE